MICLLHIPDLSEISAIGKISSRLPIGMVFFTILVLHDTQDCLICIRLKDRANLDTSSLFQKSSPQPEFKVHFQFYFNLRSVLLDFQSFTEIPVFEFAFAHQILLKTVGIVSL